MKKRLRVSHYPQIPCKPFVVEVQNEREAYLLSETLANQHLFLFEGNFIPDYSNIVNVEMWDDDLDEDENGSKWTDYFNDNLGMDWNDLKDWIELQEQETEDVKKTILSKYEIKRDTLQGVIMNTEKEAELDKLHTVLRFIKEIINDLKQL